LLLNLLTAPSALLLVTTLVLWASSYGDTLRHYAEFGDPPHHILMSSAGSVVFRSITPGGVSGDTADFRGWMAFGFGSYTMTYDTGSHHSWQVPYWAVALAAALLPAWWLRRFRRERGARRGFDVAA
jgi:hypothetical protein